MDVNQLVNNELERIHTFLMLPGTDEGVKATMLLKLDDLHRRFFTVNTNSTTVTATGPYHASIGHPYGMQGSGSINTSAGWAQAAQQASSLGLSTQDYISGVGSTRRGQ